jgi:hypothetical protein
MKTLLIFLSLIISFSALAFNRGDLNQLLLGKGTSIAAFEAKGLKLVMGERTGGGKNMQFASVEVVFTKDEAILRQEIQSVQLINGSKLSNLEALQAGGRHIDADEIIGVIAK